MNERIKELARQAGLKIECFMINPPKPFQILGSTEQFEDFAELIIKECMYAGRQSQIDNGLVDADIKQHFGIK
jgi:hypothetical protein